MSDLGVGRTGCSSLQSNILACFHIHDSAKRDAHPSCGASSTVANLREILTRGIVTFIEAKPAIEVNSRSGIHVDVTLLVTIDIAAAMTKYREILPGFSPVGVVFILITGAVHHIHVSSPWHMAKTGSDVTAAEGNTSSGIHIDIAEKVTGHPMTTMSDLSIATFLNRITPVTRSTSGEIDICTGIYRHITKVISVTIQTAVTDLRIMPIPANTSTGKVNVPCRSLDENISAVSVGIGLHYERISAVVVHRVVGVGIMPSVTNLSKGIENITDTGIRTALINTLDIAVATKVKSNILIIDKASATFEGNRPICLRCDITAISVSRSGL
jgi:hypothetical protein